MTKSDFYKKKIAVRAHSKFDFLAISQNRSLILNNFPYFDRLHHNLVTQFSCRAPSVSLSLILSVIKIPHTYQLLQSGDIE